MVKKHDDAKPEARSQIEKFRQAARQAGTDDREEHLDETIRRIAKPPADKAVNKPTK